MYRTEIQTADLDLYGVVCDTYQQALTVAVAAVTNPGGTDTVAEVFVLEVVPGQPAWPSSLARLERE